MHDFEVVIRPACRHQDECEFAGTQSVNGAGIAKALVYLAGVSNAPGSAKARYLADQTHG
jgi:hypothetical protein